MSVFEGEMRIMEHDRFETLAAFCDAMEWAVDTEKVYQRIVDVSSEYFECDSAHLHLLDLDGKRFTRHAVHYDADALDEWQMPVSMSVGRMSQLLDDGELIVMDYLNPHEDDVIPERALEQGYKSAISIPLNSSSGVFGMLSIVYKRALPWDEADYDFLREIGRVLGMFVQRMQMSKKDLEFQMLQERKRLSSEIHDNLSQMASALAIHADIASVCFDEKDVEGLEGELDAISAQARQITKVLREEMLSLRTPIEGAGEVCEDVAGILERFKLQWGFEVNLVAKDVDKVYVSEYARLQLVRIVNESLQNILRHSRASVVDVSLGRKNGYVQITVRDNGVGFDIDAVAPERLGIRIMRERAASAGGSLSVSSGAQGTTVLIEMPTVRV